MNPLCAMNIVSHWIGCGLNLYLFFPHASKYMCTCILNDCTKYMPLKLCVLIIMIIICSIIMCIYYYDYYLRNAQLVAGKATTLLFSPRQRLKAYYTQCLYNCLLLLWSSRFVLSSLHAAQCLHHQQTDHTPGNLTRLWCLSRQAPRLQLLQVNAPGLGSGTPGGRFRFPHRQPLFCFARYRLVFVTLKTNFRSTLLSL